MCELLGKPYFSGKNQEIGKYTSRLRHFDSFEMPPMNVYGNDNIFIILFGSGYFNWGENRGNYKA